jgi:hypothetical protein
VGLPEDILRVLRQNPEGVSDGDLSRRLSKYHAHVYQTCVRLAAKGLITRDTAVRPLINRIAEPGRRVAVPPVDGKATPVLTAPKAIASREWFWEGNVQSSVVSHLVERGWRIMSAANTASKERGTDIVAERDGATLYVEVKGWPSSSYSDPTRSGETKRTPPTVQALSYFGGATVSALRLRQLFPGDDVALAFPAMPRYRSLAASVERPLNDLAIQVLFVAEDGTVT